jgi:hypothetical protein
MKKLLLYIALTAISSPVIASSAKVAQELSEDDIAQIRALRNLDPMFNKALGECRLIEDEDCLSQETEFVYAPNVNEAVEFFNQQCKDICGDDQQGADLVATFDATAKNQQVNFNKKYGPHRSSLLIIAILFQWDDMINAILKKAPQIINERNARGQTALSTACSFGFKASLIEKLLAHGAEVNSKLNNGYTPLMCAARYHQWSQLNMQDFLQGVQHLIDKGADVNVENDGAINALSLAIERYNIELVKLLLKNNAKYYAFIRAQNIPMSDLGLSQEQAEQNEKQIDALLSAKYEEESKKISQQPRSLSMKDAKAARQRIKHQAAMALRPDLSTQEQQKLENAKKELDDAQRLEEKKKKDQKRKKKQKASKARLPQFQHKNKSHKGKAELDQASSSTVSSISSNGHNTQAQAAAPQQPTPVQAATPQKAASTHVTFMNLIKRRLPIFVSLAQREDQAPLGKEDLPTFSIPK